MTKAQAEKLRKVIVTVLATIITALMSVVWYFHNSHDNMIESRIERNEHQIERFVDQNTADHKAISDLLWDIKSEIGDLKRDIGVMNGRTSSP